MVDGVTGDLAPAVHVGDTIVKIDPRYFRPAEVDSLLGDASRARQVMGWVPQVGIRELVSEMAASDHEDARRMAHLRAGGFSVSVHHDD